MPPDALDISTVTPAIPEGAIDMPAPHDPTAPAFALDTGEGTFDYDSMPTMGILPKHAYRVHCLAAEADTSKSGNKMVVFQFEVLSPATVEEKGEKFTTAGTKFKSWFVFNQSQHLKLNIQALARGFQLPKRPYRSAEEMFADISQYLMENGPGSTFMWRLYTEPQYQRQEYTEEEKAAGAKFDDAPFLLDAEGNKILARHNVQNNWNDIIGGYERIQTA